jgi:ubiquinone/menaquinone biosynthesis C-methylase UbiE
VRQDANSKKHRQVFGEASEDYDRFRPGPPDEAVEWLLPNGATDVLEIGAGTGAMTRQLVGRVARVFAVEPDSRMRSVLARRVPQAEVVAGHAEELPADDSSFDAVIAASAWHWVDERRAIPEVARILRPGGSLCLSWNGPDRSVDWVRQLWAGGEMPSTEESEATDSRRRERHTVDLGADSPFEEPEHRLIRWNLSMPKDDLVGLAGTYSAVIALGPAGRQEWLRMLTGFLHDYEPLRGQDPIDVPMRCLCWRASLG